MARDFNHGCPICGEWPPAADHKCKPRTIARWEASIRNYDRELGREPERTLTDKLDEAERLSCDQEYENYDD
ncbi:MAG: hypothetical protein IT422_04930 [Pirellulaceae bacterium]|nr:hypothetical protein [Pirellulaceae bacterium]